MTDIFLSSNKQVIAFYEKEQKIFLSASIKSVPPVEIYLQEVLVIASSLLYLVNNILSQKGLTKENSYILVSPNIYLYADGKYIFLKAAVGDGNILPAKLTFEEASSFGRKLFDVYKNN